MTLQGLRTTSSNKLVGGVRLFVGMLFVMTGAMKLLVPSLAKAWSGQLLAANLPLYDLTRWSVPFIEIVLGLMLLVGTFTRLSVTVVGVIMLVASYVHLSADDPSLFPLQPTQPIVPLVVLTMSLFLLFRGGGSWSADLRATARTE